MEELKERASGISGGPWKSSCFQNKTQALSISEDLAVSNFTDNKDHFPICHEKKSNVKETRTVKSCPGISWTGGKGTRSICYLARKPELLE